MKHMLRRSGFTMIELLFVIVILGIVGVFALEAIRNYYAGIYRTGEYTKRVAQADHILEQLSKYFENAISVSIVNLDKNNEYNSICHGTPGENIDNNADYTVAFISVDNDSLRGLWNGSRYQPGWSEDTVVSDYNVSAVDANHTFANAIIDALDNGTSFTLANSALYNTDSSDVNACSRFNWNASSTTGIGFHRISGWNQTTLALDNSDSIPNYGKRKYLIRSAYAFRVKDDGNFTMYTNFRPWRGEKYTANAKQVLIGRNVAHFYADYDTTDFQNDSNVTDRGLVWRLKVCMRGLDANLSDSSYEGDMICRERRVHVRY